MRYLLALLLLTGCMNGVSQVDVEPEFSDAAVYTAIARFEAEFNLTVNSIIVFSESPYAGSAGKCFVEGNLITLNKELWVDIAYSTREAVVFHELGHCILGLGHTSQPSIMHGFLGYTASRYKNNYSEDVALMKVSIF